MIHDDKRELAGEAWLVQGKVTAPCRSCPWRTDRDATDIPNFVLEMAEGLASTCLDQRGMGPEFGAPWFACHQSREGADTACSGWLAAAGAAHPSVRLAVLRGRLSPLALEIGPGWPKLHLTFGEVIAKLRLTAAAPETSSDL